MIKKVFKRSVWTIVTIFFALFFALALVSDGIARQYASWIDSFFDVTRYKLVEKEQADDNEDTQYYKSDYAQKDENGDLVLVKDDEGIKKQTYDSAAMRDHSMEVAERVGEEGSVLMWNNNGALPLNSGDKVSIFGVSATDWLFHGTGSGNVSFTEPYLRDALRSRDLFVNDSLEKTMKIARIGYGRAALQYNGEDWRKFAMNYAVGEVPWNVLNGTAFGPVDQSVMQFGDAAIYPISRNGGEGSDTNMFEAPGTEDGKYLSWTEAELGVIKGLSDLKKDKKLKKIILLINSATMLPMKDLAPYMSGENGIDACLWVGLGGCANLEYVADLIVGNADPSGRFTDTWAYDLMSAPANENMGNYMFTEYPDLGKYDGYRNKVYNYLVYAEGIYVGYRYYETRYEDAVLGRGNADSAAGARMNEVKWNYSDEVAFPFGYGKSYTEFTYSNFKAEEKRDGNYEVSLTVKNTGTKPGKEVVQVYLQKPYTDYDRATGIEKASVELVGFAKTDVLEPGQETTVKMTVDAYEFKTYDSYGHKTYIIEKGDYYLAVGYDAHDALNNILAKKGKTPANTNNVMDAEGNASFAQVFKKADDFETYSVSPKGKSVTNRFDEADINLYEGTEGQSVKYLSRKDWGDTYPSTVALKVDTERMAKDLDPKGTFEEDLEAEIPTYNTVSQEHGKLTLIQLRGVPYDNPLWNALLDQMSFEEQFDLLRLGSHGIAGAKSVAAPGYKATDGPCGIHVDKVTEHGVKNNMAFPCNPIVASTFNRALAEECAEAMAMEVMNVGYSGIYGTGANIHRSAYGGRNWEYFSEDGWLSGEMNSAVSKGLRSKGIVLFTKHFALNDQESNRAGVSVWANEQSIREIYLKAFETAVTDGHTNGIMTSFNRIGCTWTGRHKALLTDVLRGEWGYMGLTETDSPIGPHMYGSKELIASGVVAGQDIWMGSVAEGYLDSYKTNATVMSALREAAHRNLYVQLNSSAMNGMSSTTDVIYVQPAWEKAILAMEITFGILMGLSLAAVAAGWILWYRDKREIALNRSERKGEER